MRVPGLLFINFGCADDVMRQFRSRGEEEGDRQPPRVAGQLAGQAPQAVTSWSYSRAPIPLFIYRYRRLCCMLSPCTCISCYTIASRPIYPMCLRAYSVRRIELVFTKDTRACTGTASSFIPRKLFMFGF